MNRRPIADTTVVKPAATVVLVRPDRAVLLVQRNRAMTFFGGAFAFPGGRVDASDVGEAVSGHPWAAHTLPIAGLDMAPSHDVLYGAYLRAAVREVAEETGLVLAPQTLVPWARWITPERESKRYDTLFFLAAVDAQADVHIDGGETVAHRWMQPEDALAAALAGDIVLPPPTRVTLTELADRSLAAMFVAGSIPEILPILQQDDEGLWITLPGDPLHPQTPSRPWPQGMATRARIQ